MNKKNHDYFFTLKQVELFYNRDILPFIGIIILFGDEVHYFGNNLHQNF